MSDDGTRYRYYLTEGGAPEREVDKAGFVSAERRAGFNNTMCQPDEPATAGFGGRAGDTEIRGRIVYAGPGLPGDPPFDVEAGLRRFRAGIAKMNSDPAERARIEELAREAGDLRPARACHDLNGVSVIEVSGWRGPHTVQAHQGGDQLVEICAPRRADGESWTFERQRDGVLRCHSDLTGSPSPLTVSAEPMLILLPADRVDDISVEMKW